MAMTAGLLCKPEVGQVSHSALSAAAFGSAAPLLPWAKFITNFAAPTAMRMAEATQRWGEISRTDQTAYNIAFNTPLPFFQHLTESPGGTEIFAGYMRSLNEVGGTALKHLLTGYDWASLGEAHVIDVGGNKGHASVRLASHFPHLRFTVQDLPDVVEEASTAILDLIMTQSFNSHERDLAQWMELLQSTTPRLHLKESIKPVGSQMSVSVVVREE